MRLLKKRGNDDDTITLAEQQNYFIDWAVNAEMDPKWRREIMRRISKMDRVLIGDEYDNFIRELAELKLGIGITEEEILEIMRLSRDADEARNKMNNGGSKEEYRTALDMYNRYVEKLKMEAEQK